MDNAVCSNFHAHKIEITDSSPSWALQVYVTAVTVYGLEGQLTSLEDAARKINSITAESELAELEDQVATAAAQVHHAELQVRTAAPPHLQFHTDFPCAYLLSVHT